MSNLKKALYVGASAALVLWSIGSVLPVHAVTISDGDLVKTADSPAVYYIQGSTKRVFPHANVYWSWGYKDWSGIKVVSAADLAAYSDGNPMPFRDGSLFRGKSSGLHGYPANAVYYVEGAKLRPIKSASIYQALFNDPQWKKLTWIPSDILDKFQYPLGSMIESAATHPDGCLVKYAGQTQKYLISGGKKRAISDAAFVANRFREKDVLTISSSEVYPDGDPITGLEPALVTPGWTTVTGALTVSLAEDTPAASNVPLTAQNIPFLKFKIQTGSAAATISSITIKRTGLGAATDFDKIGLFDGDVQVGQYKTLSSSTDSLIFSFGTPISIPANSVKYFTVKANLTSGGSGHVNKLGVTAISANATVSGLPVYGNSMTGTSINIGSVTAAHGSINNTSPKIGTDGAEFAVLRLQAGSVEDLEFKSVKFRQTGTARSSDVSNVGIYYSGEKKGDCSWSSDYLTCVLNTPYTIKKSETREFKVLGDINDGVNRTMILDLEEVYDLNAVGKSYGFSVPVTDSFTAQTVTFSAGSVSINFNGPEAGDITQGQDDVVLANFEIKSNSEDAELRTFYVSVRVNGTATTSASYIENVELYDPDNGGIYDGTISGNKWKFSPYINLTKGVKKTFQIRIDLPTNAPANGTYYDVYLASSDITLRGLTSNQNITDISPSTLDGKEMTVKAPGLTVTPVSLVNETIVSGLKGVPLYKALLEGSGETVKVNSIKFSAASSGSLSDDLIDHLYLYKVSGSTETLVKEMTDSEFSGGSANFTGLNLSVPAGSANAFYIVLKVDVASNVTGTLIAEITSGTDDIDVEDADGDPVAESGNFAGVDGRTVTVVASGTLSMDMDTSAEEVSRDRFVLANTTTGWLGRIKLDASYEDVKISKLVLVNETSTTGATDPSDSVERLELYKADKTTLVGTAYWTEGSDTITFDPLNYVVDDVGVDYLYIKAVLRKIGVGANDTADSKDEIRLKVHATASTCYGVSSGLAITETVSGTFTKSSIITAARPASLENALADGTLSSGVGRTIAKFKVTANSTTNQDSSGEIAKLLLKQLKITFSGNVSATNVTIQKENGIDSVATVTSTDVVGTTYDIDLASLLPNDHKIESGASATYVIKADISWSGSGQKWIQTKIDGLNNSSTAAIVWDDTYNKDYSWLWLDYSYVDGALLSVTISS